MSLITIIIPVYNEEHNLKVITEQLIFTMGSTPHMLELIFINDGSNDNGEIILKELSNCYPNLYYINFSRNFGQQNALRAGYEHSRGDAVICMDADLQNPPNLILEMIDKWIQGFQIVVCKRKNAVQNGGLIKELTSKFFYKFLALISDIPVERNVPDFRLLDRQLVNIVKELSEKDMFLRGIISWLGFKRAVVEYSHGLRIHGTTKYSLVKMIRLAISGLTSFSVKPLHMAIYLGIFISTLSICYIPYVLIRFLQGHTILGWSSLIVTVCFLGGLQLFILGIIGIYLGKLFVQAKQRPDYLIKDTNFNDEFATDINLVKKI